MNNNYVHITYQQLLEDFTARLKNDPRYKNMSSASIYYIFMEMLAATVDMTTYYMERTAEEACIDTAKLDSSVIKLGKNLGYNPIRNTPAEAEIKIVLRGPLPKSLMQTKMATIYFPQEEMDISYNGKKYILSTDYSYTLTRKDIEDGQSSTWSKTLYFSKPVDSTNYIELAGEKLYNDASLMPIKIFQGEKKYEVITGVSNTSRLGKSYQFYDINNIKFSNWYGKRDPNGWYKNQFYKKNSWTKVGIGRNIDEAFFEENLFDIEDVSIYLNSQVIQEKEIGTDQICNVCSLTTNSDKTIRLKFGDGINVANGLNKEDHNIYVQYIECDGADANMVGTTDSELKINNKIWATYAGSTPIDMSPNIKFLFNSDIANGMDFEDQQSIKNNAPLYFASNTKLISVQDFISYFKGLGTPIKVKYATAWGQDEIEDLANAGNVTYKYIQNCVCYSIASSLYNTKSNIYSVIDVLNDNTFNQAGTFTVYGSSNNYLDHLTDFIKYLLSYDSFHNVQYMNNPNEQWLKNIKTIRDNITPRVMMGSKIYSFPPIVQYYDVVGTVSVNSLSKLQEYKTEVENEIYQWLDSTCNYGKKIYKSDLVKFFTKRSETSYVDIDIRVSDIIKAQDVVYAYALNKNTKLTNIFSYNANNDYNRTPNSTMTDRPYNIVTVDKTDSSGVILNADNLKNKSMHIIITGENGKEIISENIYTSDQVFESDTKIIMNLNGRYYMPVNASFDENSTMKIQVSIQDDFYSTSNFSTGNAATYKLNSSQVASIQKEVNDWVNDAKVTRTANRAIPLPYYVTMMDSNTREETIMRKGILQSTKDYNTQLTEKAFWMYFVPKIIKEYYANNSIDLSEEDVNGEVWQAIDALIMDLYTQMKATFADSILDDNNNIVAFTMDNEIPVVRLQIKYKYGV